MGVVVRRYIDIVTIIIKGRVSWKISNIIFLNNIVVLPIKSSYKFLQFFSTSNTE